MIPDRIKQKTEEILNSAPAIKAAVEKLNIDGENEKVKLTARNDNESIQDRP